jgi:carboxyl-terminal processing protease
MKRLVLDLRDNGGGRVDQAAKIAGEFLPEKSIIYTSAGRKAETSKDTGRVDRSFFSREKRYPMIVLQNSGSASASELVTGALQDHDRALIVGRPSFGKSLLMTGVLLPDGSFMQLVVGHLKTPCGRVIQRQYRNMTYREYRRRAGATTGADTVGRPSCKTGSGRTVYGGGGIYPDVMFPRTEPQPMWLTRVRQEMLPLKWIAGHVSANQAAYPSADALAANPVLAGAALAEFRKFAREQGVVIPDGPEADERLTRLLVPEVAEAKWGQRGLYRVAAVLDPDVKFGATVFDKAAAILASAK